MQAVSKELLTKILIVLAAIVATVTVTGITVNAHHKPSHPNNAGYAKEQCKNGGWKALGFKNQGQCVSFFASGGRNAP